MLEQGQPKFNDLIDVVIQSAQENKEVEDAQGHKHYESLINNEIIWCKTGSISSNTFGRCMFELKEFERQSVEAFNHMSKDRARIFGNTIIDIGTSYRRSIDAKSSESERDKNNSCSTLIDKINRNKIEKVYTAKGEMKRSMLDAVMGRDAEKEEE